MMSDRSLYTEGHRSKHHRDQVQCWNRVFGSRVVGSTILTGSGRVTGQCDRPGVRSGFCSPEKRSWFKCV